jgi:hypothetical protein
MKLQALLLAGLVTALPGAARAAASAGAESFNFLTLDSSARSSALGGAYTALAADSNALIYNPAGLAGVRRHELTAMHTQHVQSLTHESLALALRQGVGFHVNYVRFGEIPRTTYSKPDSTLGDYSISDLALAAGYGRRFGILSLGLAAKYIREDHDTVSAQSYAFDSGLMLSPPSLPNLTLGAAVLNVGPDARFLASKEKLPLQVRAGAVYRFGDTLLSADVTKLRFDRPRPAAGIETRLAKALAIRFGFSGSNDAGLGVVGGVGWLWKAGTIDYAFVPYGDLGYGHRASLTFRWGGEGSDSQEEAPAPRARQRQRRAASVKHLPEEIKEEDPDVLIAQGRYLAAKRVIKDAMQLLPADDRRRVRYNERLGFIALAEGSQSEARAYYSDALKIAVAVGISDDSVAGAYEGMGKCLLSEGNVVYAHKFFTRALDINPTAERRALVLDAEKQLQKEGRK